MRLVGRDVRWLHFLATIDRRSIKRSCCMRRLLAAPQTFTSLQCLPVSWCKTWIVVGLHHARSARTYSEAGRQRGSWSIGVVFPAMGALSQEHGGWRFDSSRPVRDIVMESDGDVRGPVGSVWRGEVFRGWLTEPLKSEDVLSLAAGAAFFAMALMFEEWWKSAPVPPPPPPPRRDP